MKISLLFTLMLLIVKLASAQVNIEKSRLTADQDGFRFEIQSSFKLLSGNSRLFSFSLSPNGIWKKEKHQIFFLNDYSRIMSEDVSISDKGFSHIRYNYTLKSYLKTEVFVQSEFNKSRLLERRLLLGTGLRYKKETYFALGMGMMIEDEKQLEKSNTETRLRVSSYIHFKNEPQRHLQLENTIYYQPVLLDILYYRIIDEGLIKFFLSDTFSIFLKIKFRFDSHPYLGLKKTDIEINQGLSWVF